jgi:cell division protein DivIC
MNLPAFFNTYRFYIISAIILVVWLMFFDRSNLIKQAEMTLKLNELENEQAYYEEELEKVHKEEKEVLGSMNSIEKYAREKYFLKKEGETVFVLVDENDKVLAE